MKYLSILLVIIYHFFTYIGHPLFGFWKQFPYNLFLYGLNGKLSVSFFAVMAGFFAYRLGKRKCFLNYSLRRYAYFVICGFAVNTIYYALNIFNIRTENNFNLVIGQSILLDKLIFPEFWFARAFVVGSILSFIVGKSKINALYLFPVIVILVMFDDPFFLTYVGNCLFGAILGRLLEMDLDLFRNKWFQLFEVLFIYIFIKRDSTNVTYFIQGIIAIAAVLLIKYNERLFYLFDKENLAYYGRKTMSILMVHQICLFYTDSLFESRVSMFIVWIVMVHLLAIPLDYVINYIVKLVNGMIDRVIPEKGLGKK